MRLLCGSFFLVAIHALRGAGLLRFVAPFAELVGGVLAEGQLAGRALAVAGLASHAVAMDLALLFWLTCRKTKNTTSYRLSFLRFTLTCGLRLRPFSTNTSKQKPNSRTSGT